MKIRGTRLVFAAPQMPRKSQRLVPVPQSTGMHQIPQRHRFACTCGKPVLYKFRAYDTPEHREWVRQILVEHRVYMSRSSELNDSIDLKPLLRIRHGSDEAETRRNLIAAAESNWPNHVPTYTASQLGRMRNRLATTNLFTLAEEATQRTHARLDSYWVFSL